MKLVYLSKYYKKTCALTDIIAIIIQWVIMFAYDSSLSKTAALFVLCVWVLVSGRIFDYIGQKIIDEREDD